MWTKMRAILKRDKALSQSELVFLVNSDIESANIHLQKADQAVKRKIPDSAESNKRAKTQGPSVSYKSKIAIHFIFID